MPTAGNLSYAAEPRTYLAGAAIVKYRAVKRSADDDNVIPGTANSVNLGIAMDRQDVVGRGVPIATQPGREVLAEAGAAFALGARLASDAAGRLVTATTGQNVTAIARQAALALSDIVV